MTSVPPLKVVSAPGVADLRSHYETAAHNTLRLLWQRKWTMVALVCLSLAVAMVALVRMGPSYSSEAIIQLEFARESPAPSTGGVSIDATALVDSTARIIRARATADAVVTRLGLDKDPQFYRQSPLSSLLSEIRWRLGLEEVSPTPHELAVNAVMRQVRVSNDPRSYLISISASAGTPSGAARLANAVGSEYLRSQALRQVADARAAAERELSYTALTYGSQHPNYLRARARFEELQARLGAMRERKEDAESVPFGESMIPAREVLTPSGPNVTMTLGFAVVMALGGGICLARRSTGLVRSGVSGDSIPGR